MSARKLAVDPLWQCLCPSWTSAASSSAARVFATPLRPSRQCLRDRTSPLTLPRRGVQQDRLNAASRHYDLVYNPLQANDGPRKYRDPPRVKKQREPHPQEDVDLAQEPTTALYHLLRTAAIDGKAVRCREIAEVLVRERGERPSLQIYNALILSNLSHDEGSATRIIELLDDLKVDGFEPDTGTCHAVLKVLAVHVDHLLRTDVLHYMSQRWYTLSEDGAHDVAAGLFREGLFEQALRRLDTMRQSNMTTQGWLLDMAIYTLAEANELPEAYRLLRQRVDAGDTNISRSLWSFFLDQASAARHAAGVALVWAHQVKPGYLNPSSGVCLAVLATAARDADPQAATDVFTHLSKRGTAFQPIHYEHLINAYLALQPPDLSRALSILTIMPLEKLEPAAAETRTLFALLRDSPALTSAALAALRALHAQGRRIPIAALNLLIEAHVHRRDLPAALQLYKQIHTFAPLAAGAAKSFANVETFNLLLKGCRVAADGADAEQASFLVSELLALRVRPTARTYDRLILVFVSAAQQQHEESDERARELLDWAFRHFADMQPLGWLPRFGTLELLAVELARAGDARCWDALQAAEDAKGEFEGWGVRGNWARGKVEGAWAESEAGGADGGRGKIKMQEEEGMVGVGGA